MIPARNHGRDRGAAAVPRRRAAAVAGALAFAAFFGGIAALIAVFTGDDSPRTAGAAAMEGAAQAPGATLPAAGAARAADAPELVMVPGGGPAAEHLARAQSLALTHRETVLNSTAEGARQAEAEALEAFRLGAADLPGAWRILADVYDVQIEWTPSAEGRTEYRRKQRDALARALDMDPADSEARYQYGTLLEDRGARILELTRAVRELPQDPRPRRALAEDLMGAGRPEEAARLLVEAVQLYRPDELRYNGLAIVRILRAQNRPQEAAQVSAWMEQVLGR